MPEVARAAGGAVSLLPTAATLFEKLPRALRRHRLMTGWMRLTGESPLQLVRIRDRAFGYADLSDGFLRLIVIDGGFEEDFFRLADSFLAEGGEVLDIGANHGLLSFGLAHKHGATTRFHLFEPNPTLLESIHATKALYPSMHARVNAAAVSDRSGVVRFLVNPGQTGSSHIDEKAGEEIPCTTVDEYMAKQRIDRVALLKMDVEGYELAALRGASHSLAERAIQAVYFEYFEKYLVRVQPPHVLIEYLDSLDYQVCFCRKFDVDSHGGASHTVRLGLPGHGVGLVPVLGHPLPPMTDLVAIPREHLVASA